MAEIQDEPLEVAFAALQAAKEALAKTPELLPVLKKAGVVDAGGQGLILIFEGMESVWDNGVIVQPLDGSGVTPVAPVSKSTVAGASDDIEFGYCSEFLIEKSDSAKEQDPLKLRAYLESIGDCVVVVDDSDIIKVHVHSNEPGNVIQSALQYGQLINIKIDNMRYQHANANVGVKDGEKVIEPTVLAPENDYGFVAVCAGEGLEELFSDIGADVIVSGGQTMNPSTDDILNAVMNTPAKTVFVLPNNKNIIMAAEQVIPLVNDREVRVLQTKTIPQGISAMLAFDESCQAEENQMTMMDAASAVETAQVTFAARDSEVDGKAVHEGEIMGLCNGKIKFIGTDIVDIAFKATEKLFKKNEHSLITVIYGDGVSEEDASKVEEKLVKKHGTDVEISVVNGGQPIYYFIISVE
jgi:DAK2 domain fusion protein YloV